MALNNFKKHFNNLILAILAGGYFWIGASFFEYEVSKRNNPDLTWIKTPVLFNSIISCAMILGSIIIFTMLVLIYYKKLENRNWLWIIILCQAILLILLSAVLGYNKFIWILFPKTFSFFKVR